MKKRILVSCLSSFTLFASAAFGANAWMQQARRTPAWFTEGVMYQIQPRAFTPEGMIAGGSLLARRAKQTGERSYALGPYGFTLVEIK